MADDDIIRVSPSQMKSFAGCQRQWGYGYIDRMRAPSSKAQDFGTNVHTHIENWLESGILPPQDKAEGRVASQMLPKGWLPPPEPNATSRTYEVETSINLDLFKIEGRLVKLIGRIDLLEHFAFGVRVTDHKSSSGLSWAMNDEQLSEDIQAIAYAGHGIYGLGHRYAEARWLYYGYSKETYKPTGVARADFRFDREGDVFKKGWDRVLALAHDIAKAKIHTKQAKQLEGSPSACGNYGGCYYGKTRKCEIGAPQKSKLTLFQIGSKTATAAVDSKITNKKEEIEKMPSAKDRVRELRAREAKKAEPVSEPAPELAETAPPEPAPVQASEPEPESVETKAPAKKKGTKKKAPAKINPPEGDPKPEPVGGNIVVAFDCAFTKGASADGAIYHLSDILGPIQKEMAARSKGPVKHWTYSRGHYVEARAELQALFAEALESGNYNGLILANSASEDTRHVVDILIAKATVIVQSTK